jgi:hypothetical protein
MRAFAWITPAGLCPWKPLRGGEPLVRSRDVIIRLLQLYAQHTPEDDPDASPAARIVEQLRAELLPESL